AHRLPAGVGFLGAADLAVHTGEAGRHGLFPTGAVLVRDVGVVAAVQQPPQPHLLREHHVHPLPARLATRDPPCPSYTAKNLLLPLLLILFRIATPLHRRLRGGQERGRDVDSVLHLPPAPDPDPRHRPVRDARR
uniref:Uncharacterized protein n=1 Tax=Oryza brachyantha TaxID=4533 RepID=J3L2H5_ORYBR